MTQHHVMWHFVPSNQTMSCRHTTSCHAMWTLCVRINFVCHNKLCLFFLAINFVCFFLQQTLFIATNFVHCNKLCLLPQISFIRMNFLFVWMNFACWNGLCSLEWTLFVTTNFVCQKTLCLLEWTLCVGTKFDSCNKLHFSEQKILQICEVATKFVSWNKLCF